MAKFDGWGVPGNSIHTQWNSAPANDNWNDNSGGATASFGDGDTNGFDALAGGDTAREGGGGGGACYNCGQEG